MPLKGVFSNFGIPKVIVSDNGPCYKSQEFHSFCAKFDIVHQTGASYNYQANSNIECAIQTIKYLMIENQNDAWLALLILKSTQISEINRSPAELLCNQIFWNNIPLIQHASSLADEERLRGDPTKYQSGSKALVPLNLGSCILYNKSPDNIHKIPEWTKGVVTDIDGPGRKYQIENDAGRNVTRTR